MDTYNSFDVHSYMSRIRLYPIFIPHICFYLQYSIIYAFSTFFFAKSFSISFSAFSTFSFVCLAWLASYHAFLISKLSIVVWISECDFGGGIESPISAVSVASGTLSLSSDEALAVVFLPPFFFDFPPPTKYASSSSWFFFLRTVPAGIWSST